EERSPRERDPRVSSQRLLPGECVGDGQKDERTEPVDVVEPGLRPGAQDERNDADEGLYDAHHLDRREPPPEPVAGLAFRDPDHEAPQPTPREQRDDAVPD